MPLTAIFAAGFIEMISYYYLWKFIKLQMFVSENYADHSKFSVYVQATIFVFLSGMVHFLFYCRLILPIPCTQVDPGFMTREIEDRILAENGLTRNLVTGNVLDWEDICVLLNEAYFKR